MRQILPVPNDTEFSGERKRVRCNELLGAPCSSPVLRRREPPGRACRWLGTGEAAVQSAGDRAHDTGKPGEREVNLWIGRGRRSKAELRDPDIEHAGGFTWDGAVLGGLSLDGQMVLVNVCRADALVEDVGVAVLAHLSSPWKKSSLGEA